MDEKNTKMNIQDCIKFTNENPICSLATMENDQPRVRILGFWFADESGFYFQTSTIKEIPGQLKANPNAEACFYKHEGMIGTMLRISGEVEFLSDPALKQKALDDRPFLKSFGLTVDSPGMILFRISHGHAHFWNMENNLKPKEYIKF
jgi:pyridoxamine 5'-phosphate oxidase